MTAVVERLETDGKEYWETWALLPFFIRRNNAQYAMDSHACNHPGYPPDVDDDTKEYLADDFAECRVSFLSLSEFAAIVGDAYDSQLTPVLRLMQATNAPTRIVFGFDQ